MAPRPRVSWRLRLARAVLRAASYVAPAAERDDWLREWRAEIDGRLALLDARGERTRSAELDLLRRCLGGLLHALWLRRQEWTLDMLIQDLRYAARSLAARPGFAIVATLTLALGIGAATTIFSVVYGVLLRPLPFREPDRLVQLWETNPTMGWTQATVAPANLKDWIARNHVFDSVAWYVGSDTKGPSLSSYTLNDEGGPEQLWGVRVSPNFFAVLGVGPALGRGFEAGEDTPGAPTSSSSATGSGCARSAGIQTSWGVTCAWAASRTGLSASWGPTSAFRRQTPISGRRSRPCLDGSGSAASRTGCAWSRA